MVRPGSFSYSDPAGVSHNSSSGGFLSPPLLIFCPGVVGGGAGQQGPGPRPWLSSELGAPPQPLTRDDTPFVTATTFKINLNRKKEGQITACI